MACAMPVNLPTDVSNICRTCCRTALPHNAVSVFHVHMFRKLMALASVQVWPADGLPERICHDCIVKLDISFQFKKQCETSDRHIRQHMTTLQTAKEQQTNDILEHSVILDNSSELAHTLVSVQVPPDVSHSGSILTDISRSVPLSVKGENESIEYTFADINRLNELKTVSKEFQCKTCFKVFNTATKLSRHNYVHSGQKPFKCEACKKTFSHNSNLKAHMKLHSDEKPYICHLCQKGCKRAKDLEMHMRTHTGEKPHVCKTCGKAFTSSSNLIAHYRTHTGEKPYVCSICQKAFCQSNELSKHKKIHIKEKHVCEICNKTFSGSSALIIHVMNHNEEKSNVCNICYKSFGSSSSLAVHLEKHDLGLFSM